MSKRKKGIPRRYRRPRGRDKPRPIPKECKASFEAVLPRIERHARFETGIDREVRCVEPSRHVDIGRKTET